MSKKKLVVLSSLGLVFAPLLAFAATACNSPVANIGDVLCKIGGILNSVIPILVALGAVYFVWGVVQYIMTGDEAKKKEGRTKMIYGLIGLVVIFCMWGLVVIIQNSFGLTPGTIQTQFPCVPIPPNTTCT